MARASYRWAATDRSPMKEASLWCVLETWWVISVQCFWLWPPPKHRPDPLRGEEERQVQELWKWPDKLASAAVIDPGAMMPGGAVGRVGADAFPSWEEPSWSFTRQEKTHQYPSISRLVKCQALGCVLLSPLWWAFRMASDFKPALTTCNSLFMFKYRKVTFPCWLFSFQMSSKRLMTTMENM